MPYPVQISLYGFHIKPGTACFKGGARIRGEYACINVCLRNFYIFWVVGAQDLQGRQALICQCNGTPLGHSAAGSGSTVAERGKVRSVLPLYADVLIENFVNNSADGFINGTSIYKILVISGAVSYVKAISPAFVQRNQWV